MYWFKLRRIFLKKTKTYQWEGGIEGESGGQQTQPSGNTQERRDENSVQMTWRATNAQFAYYASLIILLSLVILLSGLFGRHEHGPSHDWRQLVILDCVHAISQWVPFWARAAETPTGGDQQQLDAEEAMGGTIFVIKIANDAKILFYKAKLRTNLTLKVVCNRWLLASDQSKLDFPDLDYESMETKMDKKSVIIAIGHCLEC